MKRYEGLRGVLKGYEGVMRLTLFTAFQPKLKEVCPKGVGPTPSD